MKDATPIRPWRMVAAEISQESNSQRFTDLCCELESALDQLPVANKEDVPTSPSPSRKTS